jgi:hypothetical protein
MIGSTSTGPSGSSFSYSESNSYSEYATDYGNVTMGTIVSPFSEYTASSATYRYSVSEPPVATAYQQSVYSSTLTGSTPAQANFSETTTAGHADTAGTLAAGYAGRGWTGSDPVRGLAGAPHPTPPCTYVSGKGPASIASHISTARRFRHAV